MHEDAVKHIESFVDRQISCLESTVVERQYVKVVLEMWLRKSLRKAIDYLNDETIDISVEMPTLLKELNSINSFEDIGLKLNEAACQLTNLCDPGCQYLQLILDQVDLFKNTLRFSVLVASYFKQFKACLDDVGKDQTNGMRNRELIVALNALLQVASEDVGIQNVLEKSFTGKDVKDFDDANGKDLINQLVEIFESYSVTSKNESSEWFNELKSGKEWEPKLQVLIKETCKAFLFPKTTIEIKEEYGRKIIFIKGVSVFVSKIIEEMQRLKESNPEKLIKEWQTDGLKLNHTSIVDFVFVYDYAVQKKCTKKGDEQTFRLRDTQRVTIVTLLLSEGKNVLTQVSTGEGKSLIVAGVAIAFALCRNKENKKKKIDVITSNDVLARRDSTLTVADCGLRDLYEYFNVSVANNCSQWVDERTQAYNAIVVYGQLANFQRDYLLDNFYDHNIRGDRTMDLAIIDEVDCMLLDRGSNTLYLSHDIPGMEMLESLYVFIWGKIRSSSNGSNHIEIIKSIKSAILHDLYGAITKDDLESIHSPLKDKPSEKNALWDHLVETKVIDLQGRLLMEDTIESINFNPQINPKVKFYLSSVAKRERSIRIPEHLMPFVDLHLDTWLNNAMQALELKRDEDYVVDQDRTDTNPNLNPQVIIIDRDTGMDQTSSQWDGALHQFVQLKEGCKLTSQCLKAIFVSNAKYVQSYEKTLGVSGTLGSGPERDFLLRNYSSIPVEIPTAFQKRFYLRPTRIFSSEEHWLHAIVKEARQIIVPEDRAKARSLVIFCQSINNVNIIYRYLKNAFKGQIKANHIHCYTRDYEKFAFEGKPLGVGHVIIATNLAGRGTDIKISDQLRENGGLHICLTFLSKNERIEEQAIGRTARNGAPGSGIFLLWETSPMVKKWGAGKWLSMKEERQWREKQRISRLQEDFGDTEFEKSLFDKLSDYYSKLKRKLKEEKREHQEIKTICDSVLDKWALWLDQREDHISYMAGTCLARFALMYYVLRRALCLNS
ncbi:hypothetical protein GHT06_006398 [Daphnia sinensis]|uniref:Uncharacterized protein n=1 Tax=Daphnia sinensis TaxID=1820382 RepID=A0AAD5KFY9_9CRUS|nr:hypothetical protein GHT06_006398 [Daphnia sinensis]